MRNKGPVWAPELQKLIVESYLNGASVHEIAGMPGIRKLAPSEFTIRNILKANKIKPTWKKQKRRPEIWDQKVVDTVIGLRNRENSIRAIKETVNEKYPDLQLSKSTIVRMLDENASRLTYSPRGQVQPLTEDAVDQIVALYTSGMTISDILQQHFLKEFSPSDYMIRDALKKRGVEMTWKKGELRRWSPEMQELIVELYEKGMNFEEIKRYPSVSINNPTDYAIRNILKKHGIKTRGPVSYSEPISEIRFRQYRDGLLSTREEAILHRHLATDPSGRETMFRRMGIGSIQSMKNLGESNGEIDKLITIVENWKQLYSWVIHNFGDEELKKRMFRIGLQCGRSIAYLRRTLKEGDAEKESIAWRRVLEVTGDMAEVYQQLLVKPARQFRIIRLRDHT